MVEINGAHSAPPLTAPHGCAARSPRRARPKALARLY
nr:MAG TPA: hypothetical protein [Caudoviricetes sp.]